MRDGNKMLYIISFHFLLFSLFSPVLPHLSSSFHPFLILHILSIHIYGNSQISNTLIQMCNYIFYI